jgi:rod shape-determining protein MreD
VTVATGAKIAALVFVAAIVQVSVVSSFAVGVGPDVLLVVLVGIALLRGAATGAVVGFAAGLVVDVATLGTLGLTSLLLTLACYWVGRYGETTGRGRPHALLAAIVASTVFVGIGGYALHSMLGESVAPRAVIVAVLAAVVWNALLAYPVFALVRRLVGSSDQAERGREVELLV